MNFIGRYIVNKFNKNKQKISQHVFYNHITDAGKKLILNLLEQASTKKFHNMQGYKVLNLQPYTIQTVFDESKSNYYQPEGKGFETWFGNLTQRSTDKIVFDVKSSLFFSYEYDFRYPSGTNDNHNSDNKKRKYPIYPAICYGKLYNGGYTSNESNYSYITEYYDYYSDDNGGNSTLLNNNSYSANDVDKILMQNNLTSFSWKSKDFIDGYYRGDFLSKGLHNIDLFLVKCTQSILLNSQLFNNNTQIPLWGGCVRVGEDTEKRKTTLKYDSGSNHYYCLVGRYRVVGNEQWVYFEKNDVSIEFDSKYYLKLKDSKFNNSDYEIQLVYYMYYQDKQLDNGICGMYLNYLQNIDNQKKDSLQFDRQLFGNGVFSYDGGKTNDEYVAFPWQGKPIKRNTYYFGRTSNSSTQNETAWTRYYGPFFYDHKYTYHYAFFTNQYMDSISDRYYSFYPYVTAPPNCFRFHLDNHGQTVLTMKNIIFLIPDLKQHLNPRVFVFGNTQNKQNSDEKKYNQLLYVDTARTLIQEKDSDLNFSTIAQWVTHIDYQEGNDVDFNWVGMKGCENTILNNSIYGNWKFIRPIKKQDCNILFSMVELDEAFSKNSEQAIQVFYQIGIGEIKNEQ